MFKVLSLKTPTYHLIGVHMPHKYAIQCLFLSLFFSMSLLGQNLAVTKKIKPAFEKYFGQPRVSIFLHTNKSAYVKGEHIWFKGYLYNRFKGVPLKEPVNLYVGIYDRNGNQLAKHLFLGEDGYTQGQIQIDSIFKPGQYYIKASTSWMRNFVEDDSFVQQFAVLGEEALSSKESGQMGYDVQFFPEGGHWVNNVQGVLGIKALDEKGKSIAGLNGVVRNQIGEEITRFTTNRFGLSKITMTPFLGERYWAFIDSGTGDVRRFALPRTDNLGLTLSLRNLDDGRVMVLIGTNPETRKQIGSKPYSILIHRDGLLKSLDVVFDEDELYISHILDKGEFHNGMNIVTLINNQGDPIAERLYFNENEIKKMALAATIEKTENDSLIISVSGFDKDNFSAASVSVLPKETKAYNHNANIQSTFLLKPYVRGFVEHAHHYFEESFGSRKEDLDVLLLTQGWSRYNWENIFNTPPQKTFGLRTGVDVLGSINTKIPKNTDLLLYAGNNVDPTIIYLNEESTDFKLKNYYFEKGEELKLTLLNKRGDLSRPNLFIRLNTGETEDRIYDFEPYNIVDDLAHAGGIEENYLQDFIFPKNIINLDEVVVRDKAIGRSRTTPYVLEEKLKPVTTETEGLYPRLIDLIRSNGFNIWEMPNTGYDRIRITTKRPLTFSLTQPSPILYINDVRYSDFNVLIDFPTSRIERYYINRSGDGEAGGAGGVIRVYTRKEGDVGAGRPKKISANDRFFTHIVEKGFNPKKEYYNPNYQNMMNDSFRHFGTIHWIPDLSIDEKGIGRFKIPDTGLKEVLLFIEGMSENGTLYSAKKIIGVSTDQ